MIDFNTYSLALVRDGKIIFSSDKPGLNPLVKCINYNKTKGTALYDKVVGLAAAMLIAKAGIKEIHTRIISKPARDFLNEKGIEVEYEDVVDNILNKEKNKLCPMEEKALSLSSIEFFEEIKKIHRKCSPTH